MPRPIFLTGLARGGTNLLARMLNAGGACRIAIHAFQPWFKSLRNALVHRHGTPSMVERFNFEGPFGDGYFNDLELAVQDILHAATLDLPFAKDEWPALLDQLNERASHDAPDLCAGLAGLAGATGYREMMDRIVELVRQDYERDAQFVGLIDTWIIDLLPTLARAYPDACFVVVIRDPRAVVASQVKFLESAPEQVGHVLSIVRQWRKFVALSHRFQSEPLFKDRFRIVRYEDQVGNPERFARALCEFIHLPYRPSMIDFGQYQDQARSNPWKGNSAFAGELRRIDPSIAGRWRQTLSPEAIAAIEYCCGADMEVCGYAPLNQFDRITADPRPLAFLIQDGMRKCAWRTDSGNANAEYALEAARREWLTGTGRPVNQDIRRAFLSPGYFEMIRGKECLFAAG